MKTRVCIADSVAVFRAGVREVLEREQDFEVVEASDLESLEPALDAGVDMVLVDRDLPPSGVYAAIAAAKDRCSEIVVWSLQPEPNQVLAAVRAGATGYLRKEITPGGLVRSLRGAVHGESPLSRELTALMIDAIHAAESNARTRELASVLSAREREVLNCVAQGSRNKQIAAELTISEFTVKRHVQNILRKLELPSRRAAAAFYSSLTDAMSAGGRAGV